MALNFVGSNRKISLSGFISAIEFPDQMKIILASSDMNGQLILVDRRKIPSD